MKYGIKISSKLGFSFFPRRLKSNPPIFHWLYFFLYQKARPTPLEKLREIGAYELYYDGLVTYSIRFIDLMESDEYFMDSSLEGVIETAYRYAQNPDWLNEKIKTPSYKAEWSAEEILRREG